MTPHPTPRVDAFLAQQARETRNYSYREIEDFARQLERELQDATNEASIRTDEAEGLAGQLREARAQIAAAPPPVTGAGLPPGCPEVAFYTHAGGIRQFRTNSRARKVEVCPEGTGEKLARLEALAFRIEHNGFQYEGKCSYCGNAAREEDNDDTQHRDDCLWLEARRARAALAEKGGSHD